MGWMTKVLVIRPLLVGALIVGVWFGVAVRWVCELLDSGMHTWPVWIWAVLLWMNMMVVG